ncbi:MAG: winged helix-turn-helix domain-containing protein [Candidatus Hadarchaeum sp.]|uniref:ArsR/SmtB family transcription factor n=1 Tax=Candidatus Hadarchaeum sp. TaxID=2883567 RepID=UPI00316E0653
MTANILSNIRKEILKKVYERPMKLTELADLFKITPQGMLKHIRKLKAAGLIETRQEVHAAGKPLIVYPTSQNFEVRPIIFTVPWVYDALVLFDAFKKKIKEIRLENEKAAAEVPASHQTCLDFLRNNGHALFEWMSIKNAAAEYETSKTKELNYTHFFRIVPLRPALFLASLVLEVISLLALYKNKQLVPVKKRPSISDFNEYAPIFLKNIDVFYELDFTYVETENKLKSETTYLAKLAIEKLEELKQQIPEINPELIQLWIKFCQEGSTALLKGKEQIEKQIKEEKKCAGHDKRHTKLEQAKEKYEFYLKQINDAWIKLFGKSITKS